MKKLKYNFKKIIKEGMIERRNEDYVPAKQPGEEDYVGPRFEYYRWLKANEPEAFEKDRRYNWMQKGVPLEDLEKEYVDTDYEDEEGNCPHDIGREADDGDWDEYDAVGDALARVDGYADQYGEEDEMDHRKGDEVEEGLGPQDYSDPMSQPPEPEFEWPEYEDLSKAFPEVEQLSDEDYEKWSEDNYDRVKSWLAGPTADEDFPYDAWADEQAMKQFESLTLKRVLAERKFKDRKRNYRKIGTVKEKHRIDDALKGYPRDEYYVRVIKVDEGFELYVSKKDQSMRKDPYPKDLYDFIQVVEDEEGGFEED